MLDQNLDINIYKFIYYDYSYKPKLHKIEITVMTRMLAMLLVNIMGDITTIRTTEDIERTVIAHS